MAKLDEQIASVLDTWGVMTPETLVELLISDGLTVEIPEAAAADQATAQAVAAKDAAAAARLALAQLAREPGEPYNPADDADTRAARARARAEATARAAAEAAAKAEEASRAIRMARDACQAKERALRSKALEGVLPALDALVKAGTVSKREGGAVWLANDPRALQTRH